MKILETHIYGPYGYVAKHPIGYISCYVRNGTVLVRIFHNFA